MENIKTKEIKIYKKKIDLDITVHKSAKIKDRKTAKYL